VTRSLRPILESKDGPTAKSRTRAPITALCSLNYGRPNEIADEYVMLGKKMLLRMEKPVRNEPDEANLLNADRRTIQRAEPKPEL